MQTHSSSSSTTDPRIGPLVEACLDAIEDRGDADVAAICADHPDLEATVRERLARLREIGLLEGEVPRTLGDFVVGDEIGGGGMGVVYHARQVSLNREVALKLIRPEQLYFEGARERFRREVEAVARLQHPGIVPVYVVGEERGIPFFAMERIRGANLAEILEALADRPTHTLSGDTMHSIVRGFATDRGDDDSGTNSDSRAPMFRGSWSTACLHIAAGVCEALMHAHANGVLHRDVKPSNIILTPTGRVVLLDFGLARTEQADQLTRSGSQLGSLPYMAPEQVRGETSRIGEATDVYGLGATLYELLTLQRPFRAENPEELRAQILAADATPVRQIHTSVTWDVETVCTVAMDPDPTRRYPSAVALAADIDNALSHRAISGRRPGAALRMRRWSQRNPVPATALAVVVVTTMIGSIVFGILQQQAARRDREAARRVAGHLTDALSAVDTLTVMATQDLEFVPESAEARNEMLGQALLFYERLLARSNEKEEILERTLNACHRALLISNALGKHEDSVRLADHGLEAVQAHPSVEAKPETARVLGRIQVARARALEKTGNYEGAVAAAEAAVEYARASGDGPRCISPDWATTMMALGNAYRSVDRHHDARVAHTRSLVAWSGISVKFWRSARMHVGMASVLVELAKYSIAQGELDRALSALERARTQYEQAFQLDSRRTGVLPLGGAICLGRARAHNLAGDAAAALEAARAGIEKLDAVMSRAPRQNDAKVLRAQCHNEVGRALFATGDLEAATEAYRVALGDLPERDRPAHPEENSIRARIHRNTAEIHEARAARPGLSSTEARECAASGLEHRALALKARPKDADLLASFSTACVDLAARDTLAQRYGMAIALLSDAVAAGLPAERLLGDDRFAKLADVPEFVALTR